jgi:hypothetical protein
MRAFLVALVLLATLAASVRAQPASAADEAAIHSVIAGQIDAFRHDDAAAAFGYAAPLIQSMFGTPDHFLDMVRRGYAPVYRPRSLEFSGLAEVDGSPVQSVELTGPDGLGYTAQYTMERQADGSWRISACELLESRRTGA